MNKKELTGLLIVIMLIPLNSVISSTNHVNSTSSSFECSTLYFFNGIRIYNSTISEELYLETPGNISLNNGFEQKVIHLLSYNVEYNESTKLFMFRVEHNESFEGFFISKIIVCNKPLKESLSLLVDSIRYPTRKTYNETTIPEEVRQMYLKSPNPKVVEVVVPAFEEWFKQTYGVSVDNASLIGIASTAALFIYGTFIEYSAGATPRSIEEVVEMRKGDCDDMSRVLVELLNYYNIPAIVAYGYVYISNFKYDIPVENVTYFYLNNGPHAFTMAYIPGYGWLSLDLLAGSLLNYPFVFEGYTRDTSVSREEVEEFISLHRALKAKQVIAILSEKELSELIGSKLDFNSTYMFFNSVMKEEIVESTTNTTTLNTSSATPENSVNITSGVVSIDTQVTTAEKQNSVSLITAHSSETSTREERSNVVLYVLIACLLVLMFVSILHLHRIRSMQ
ncbi:MAG: transglutaminase-like domain-containing protein [Desulfurococcaceae archaeon]